MSSHDLPQKTVGKCLFFNFFKIQKTPKRTDSSVGRIKGTLPTQKTIGAIRMSDVFSSKSGLGGDNAPKPDGQPEFLSVFAGIIIGGNKFKEILGRGAGRIYYLCDTGSRRPTRLTKN